MPKTEGHSRVRRTAPPLAEDAQAPSFPDRIPHHHRRSRRSRAMDGPPSSWVELLALLGLGGACGPSARVAPSKARGFAGTNRRHVLLRPLNTGSGGRTQLMSKPHFRGDRCVRLESRFATTPEFPRVAQAVCAGSSYRWGDRGPRAAISSSVSFWRQGGEHVVHQPAAVRGVAAILRHHPRCCVPVLPAQISAPASAASSLPVWCHCTSTATCPPEEFAPLRAAHVSPRARRSCRTSVASCPDGGPVSNCSPLARSATSLQVSRGRPRGRWSAASVSLPLRDQVLASAARC